MSQETFADRLNKLMESSGLTVREASSLAGVSTSTLQNWRTGSIPTDFSAVKNLAKSLGVSLSFLLTGEDDSRPSGDIKVHEVFSDGGQLFEGFLEVSIRRLIPREKKH